MYDVYFDKVILPVAPSKIKTDIKSNDQTVDLINDGEVNILKTPGLTEVSFDILLPNLQYPFAKYPSGFKNAAYYLDLFEDYKKNKKPFQFIVSRILPSGRVLFYTNLRMTMESYSISDDTSQGFDMTVSLKLKQYKPYGTKTVNIAEQVSSSSGAGKRAAGAGADTAGTKYTIVSGDTLWNIAKKMLGDGGKWNMIYSANMEIIENTAKAHGLGSSSNGHWIYPGTVITIPDADAPIVTASSAKRKSGSYKGTGGSTTNPPYTILSSTYSVVKIGFKSFGAAVSYYSAYSGKSKGWKIVDSNNRVVEI